MSFDKLRMSGKKVQLLVGEVSLYKTVGLLFRGGPHAVVLVSQPKA